MKRHASLQPLSRDHHEGLMLARTLGEAAEKDAATLRKALDQLGSLWNAVLRSHFEEEEKYLIPLLQDSEYTKQLLAEHEEIRSQVEAVLSKRKDCAGPAEKAVTLSRLLHDHIRWEERVVFPYFERSVTEDNLVALGEVFREIEKNRPRFRSCPD